MAIAHGDHPEQPSSPLRQERLACGIEEPALDDVVSATRREGDCYRMEGCAKVLKRVTQELRTLAAPVLEEDTQNGLPAGGPFTQRLETLLARLPVPKDDLIQGQSVQEITRAGGGQQDSVHQLVMDLHRRLNAMQAELAEQRLDGAAVYRIDEADRLLIAAFMAGLNRTAPLKFNHPGLATTATRAGDTLVIQNDLGTTDAHVIVIRVKGTAAQVTYTDIHIERAQFFRDMLRPFAVSWGQDQAGQLAQASEDANFTMLVGSYEAKNQADLQDYLNFLGSRLVFLIDWNRARKQLRNFLRGAQREAVLGWAAEAEVGHRGFLELGGAQIINQAIEKVSGSAMHFGDRLCDVLGDEAAVKFIQFVFRAATEGLKERQSTGLIQDRVCAELQVHFSSEGQRLLQIAGEHAGLIFELATQVRDGVRAIACEGNGQDYGNLAKRARAFEHDADQLVVAARDAVRKRPEYAALFKVTETADDAADELEEVAFLLGLLKASKPGGEALDALAALGGLLVEAAQEWTKAVAHAAHVKKAGHQEDADDFLLAIDRLLALEHQADDAERALTYAAVQRARNFRQLHLYSEIGGSLESAADALKCAGLIARDQLFASVLGA
jgi:uncharacterized protein Yka (UPF0111/DUF47 family)